MDLIFDQENFSHILKMGSDSQKEFWAVVGFVDDCEQFPIVDMMIQKADEGLDVRLITRPDQLTERLREKLGGSSVIVKGAVR